MHNGCAQTESGAGAQVQLALLVAVIDNAGQVLGQVHRRLGLVIQTAGVLVPVTGQWQGELIPYL